MNIKSTMTYFCGVLFLLLSLSFAYDNKFIVTTGWLADHLNDGKLVILQVGKKAVYDSLHIPGAQYIAYDDYAPEINGLFRQVPSIDHLDSLFESYGISDDSRIILYTDSWITPTARLYLTFDYFGLAENVSILNGGLLQWIAENRETTNNVTKVTKGNVTPKPNKNIIVTKDELLGVLNNPDYTVIDARTEDSYSGTNERSNYPRPGHVTGAFNIQFTDLTTKEEPYLFKSDSELKKYYDNAFVNKDKTTIAYCHIGQQASLVYFVGKMLGYNMKLYDGSFQEWSADENCPIVGKVNVKHSN